jgi:hypothetical protein
MTVFSLYRPEGDVSRGQMLDALAAMPEQLRALVAGCAREALVRRADDGGWSALEVCRHMRDIAQVYGARFKWMILDDEPFLPNYDEDRWVADAPEGPDEIEGLLDEIAAYRDGTMRLLRRLDDAGWRRTGRHEVLGTVELEPYVRHEYVHEQQHLDQIAQALG